MPAVLQKNSSNQNQQRGLGYLNNGLMNMMYGGQDDLEDEDAMIKRAIELSQMDAKIHDMMFEDEIPPEQEG